MVTFKSKTKEKATLKQRLLGRTLTGKIVRGVGAAGVLGLGAGALKARSYLGGLKGTAKEKGEAAYKTYATNTGSTTDAGKYAEKAQRGSYVGKIKRDLGRYIGADKANWLGEKLYKRTRNKDIKRNKQAFAYSRRDVLSAFTMGAASYSLYGKRAEFASKKNRDEKPKKKGNAISKGIRYGVTAGALLGAAHGANAMRLGLKHPRYKNLPKGTKAVTYGIGSTAGAINGAASLGILGGLGGLGVYGINRLRKRGEDEESDRSPRGRLRQLKRRINR